MTRRLVHSNKRMHLELRRLLYAILWFLSCATIMILGQVYGDNTYFKNRRKGFTKSNRCLYDFMFDNFPQIPRGSLLNQDTAVVSFVVISLLGALLHFPLNTAIARARRWFWLYGAGYAMRMTCLFSTVLPPSHSDCHRISRDFIETLLWIPQILLGMDHTCSDHMFSGHTLGCTLLMWLWTDARIVAGDAWYYPLRIYPILHLLFMVSTSILGHDHYTVDIVVAFIIATFLYWFYTGLLLLYHLKFSRPKRNPSLEPMEKIKENGSSTAAPGKLSRLVAWMDGDDLIKIKEYSSDPSEESIEEPIPISPDDSSRSSVFSDKQ